MKKVFSFFLSLLMIFQLAVPLTASAGDNPSVYISTSRITPGETVKMPVVINGVANLLGFKLTFGYDKEVLTPLSVDYGDILSSGLQDNLDGDAAPGSFNVYWAGSEPLTKTGTLFYITFKVTDEMFASTKIKMSYSQADTFDDDLNDVLLNVSDCNILVGEGAYKYAYTTLYDADKQMSDCSKEISAGDNFYLNLTTGGLYVIKNLLCNIKYDNKNIEFLGIAKYKEENPRNYIMIDTIPFEDDGSISVETITSETSESKMIFHEKEDYVLDESDIENGYDLAFCFKAKDTCFAGNYEIKAEPVSYDIVDYCYARSFDLKVNSTETSEIAQIGIPAGITAQEGDEITVPVNIQNNHGIMGYRITVKYNPNDLEIVLADRGDDFKGNFNTSLGNKNGELDLLWSSTDEVVKDGTLFELKFNVITEKNVTSSIEISYSQDDTFDEEYKDVIFNCNNGELKLCYRHIYEMQLVNPTCTEQGCDEYVCTGCGDIYKVNYTSAIGHLYKVKSYDNNKIEYICADCNDDVKKPGSDVLAMWNVEYCNKAPQRTTQDNSSFLNVCDDNVINAKDFALINKISKNNNSKTGEETK